MVALILIACAVVGGIFYLRKNKIIGIKLSGSGVTFDNPTFFGRRNTPSNDTLQIIPNEGGVDNTTEITATTSAGPWKQEPLHAASSAGKCFNFEIMVIFFA